MQQNDEKNKNIEQLENIPPFALDADGHQNVWASCSRCSNNGVGMYNEPCDSCVAFSNFR